MAKRITLSFTWKFILGGFGLLIFMIAGLCFGGYKLYQKIALTEKNQAFILQEQNQLQAQKEAEAQKLIASQAIELSDAKAILEKTKTDAQKTSVQVATLTQTIKEQNAQQKDIVISSTDLASYTSGVVEVVCTVPSGISSGSGSLWTFKEVPRAVLTNYHVVKDATKCVILMTNSANNVTGMFSLKSAIYTYNSNTDEAVLEVGQPLTDGSVPVGNYNYSLADLKKCVSPLAVGTPVVIIGFPAYAKRDSTVDIPTIGTVNSIFRTVTNGIISGYDTSGTGSPNYFVSAKIDNGNSGGIAIAKDTTGLCSLGLPTWLTVGNYETQGLVQNIHNILPADK
jgi:hypothetical protein